MAEHENCDLKDCFVCWVNYLRSDVTIDLPWFDSGEPQVIQLGLDDYKFKPDARFEQDVIKM